MSAAGSTTLARDPNAAPTTAPAIEVTALRKSFVLPGEDGNSLRARILHPHRSAPTVVQALDGVDLSVGHGESVGIIGRNGSGKSTLLRCIAGIYRPDSGVIGVRARVSAVITLSAGMDPDLPVRDNALLGMVLRGMDPGEARRRTTEVIAVAGLEGFEGQRMRNLSAGMAARLGFAAATAAADEADAILFDEALAVADRAFKASCRERIAELRDRGRALVVVSHSLDEVRELCDRCVVIDQGRVVDDGTTEEVADRYERRADAGDDEIGTAPARRAGSAVAPAASGDPARAFEPAAAPRRVGIRGVAVIAWVLAQARFKVRYLDSVLGYLWAVVRPLAYFAVLLTVFTVVGSFDEGVRHYPLYLLMGIVLWTLYSESTSTALISIVRSRDMVRSLPVTPLVAPLAVLLSSLMDLGMTMLVVVAAILVAGVTPTIDWLQLPLAVALVAVFASGTGTLLAALYVGFRDVNEIWTVVRQALFYGSPILFTVERYPDSAQGWASINPLAAAITQAHHAVIDPTAPSVPSLLGGLPWSLAPLAVAFGILALGWLVALKVSATAAEHL